MEARIGRSILGLMQREVERDHRSYILEVPMSKPCGQNSYSLTIVTVPYELVFRGMFYCQSDHCHVACAGVHEQPILGRAFISAHVSRKDI